MKVFTVLSTLAYAAAPINCLQNRTLTPSYTSPQGVKVYNPEWMFNATGPWSIMATHDNTLYISGMRGIYRENSTLVPIDGIGEYTGPPARSPALPRILKAFENIKILVETAGASLGDCVRVVVYTTDMYRFRPVVNVAQQQIWGPISFPPRTIIEVSRLNQDDIVEIETTFIIPDRK